MSSIEDTVYHAHEHGLREKLFIEVVKLKEESPNMRLIDVYYEAYNRVKTINT